MLDRLKDVGQTAVTTGERAFRLLWDIVSVASERLRDAAGPPPPPPVQAVPPPVRPPAPTPKPAPAAASQPASPPAAKAPAKAKSKPKTTRKAKKGARKGQKRPDQMIRVLELLEAAPKDWLSAKELSDAGEAAGTPILPGNVRKVIRARGGDLVATRPRDGSRRGALEYRITDVGKAKINA